MGDDKGAKRGFWAMPKGDPTLGPLQHLIPALGGQEALEQGVHLVFEGSLEVFALEDYPIVIEAG
jgi:hypothetical protein